MNETVKKYGVWIGAGVLVLYLVYRQTRGGARPLVPSAAGGAPGDQYRLESERLKQAGAFDLQRLQLEQNLELQRLKLGNDRYNLEQQALARNRALDMARSSQTSGLINQLLKNLEALMRGKTGSTGGGEGRSLPTTPNTFPGRPQLPPAYPIPVPSIDVFSSPYEPEYPQITEYPLSVTDWGEAPQFESAGMGLDTGASFYDQWGYDWNYSTGFGDNFFGLDEPYDLYSGNPELQNPTDYYGGEDIYLTTPDYDYGDYGGDYGGSYGGEAA